MEIHSFTIRLSARLQGAALALAGILAATAAWGAELETPNTNKWEGSVALGATIQQGNSDSVLVTLTAAVQRKWERDQLQLGMTGGYGEARPQGTDTDPDPDMQKNTDYLGGMAQYNRLFSERFYAYGRADALHDDIADIMYRVMLSPGAGYHFIKEEKLTLSGEVGPGYIWERLRESTPTGNVYDNSDYWTIRVGEKLQWQISKTARLWQALEYLPEVSDWGNYIINASVGVEANITSHLLLQVVLLDTYDSEPAAGSDENDLKLIAGLGYKF
jgi:putative salt-induced outer membrane protein